MTKEILESVTSRLRDMRPYKAAAASINHVAILPEVQHALAKWIQVTTIDQNAGTLIGGLAMSFYAKPRTTEDVDLLYLSIGNIPSDDQVPGFKRYRRGAFREKDTHVDIEVTTPESFLDLPHSVALKVIQTAVNHGGIKVASLEGMVALKLCSALAPKRLFKDMADIVALLENSPELSMSHWELNHKQLELLETAREKAKE